MSSPTDPGAQDLVGAYTARRAPFLRRLAMDAFDALRSGHPILALLELDVTAARAAIAERQRAGERVSLFAFLVHAIAATLAEHPSLNSVRAGGLLGHRIYTFEDVDVSVPVEVAGPEGPAPLELVLRRAHTKSPAALFAEIEAARGRFHREGELGREDRVSRRYMWLAGFVPPFVRRFLLRAVMDSPLLVKRWSGTTLVTSVARFASASGFVIPLTGGPRATTFAIGGVVDRPVVVDGEIAVRAMQSVTIVFDHALVDGGPAARFVRRLQERIEGAEGLK